MDLTHGVLAHIAGMPVEEVLLPLVYVAGTLWAALRVATSRGSKSAGTPGSGDPSEQVYGRR